MELAENLRSLRESVSFKLLIRRYGMLIVFLVIAISLSLYSPAFRSMSNLVNILQQNAVYAIVACGMLLMIIVGGFDLSVGAVAALSNVTAAYIFKISSIPLGVVGGLLLGVLVGVFNGVLISKAKINPFVATLGSSTLVRGLLFVSTNAEPVYGLPSGYTVIGMGSIGPIPITTVIAGLVILLTLVILHYTLFGHHIYSVGGNEEAARLAGINVDRIKIATYGIGGFFAALGGLILLSQSNIGQPAVADGLPLTIIAIVVIGGTPLTGGVGNISAPIIGTLMLGVISNGLNLLNASPYWKPALTGLIVILAVASERYWAQQGEN